MQFRFRTYNKEKEKYDLITLIDVEDYDTMFKTLIFMKEHKCEYPIEVNIEGIVETFGENYDVLCVSLCVDSDYGEEGLVPHFVVDIE